MTAANAYDRQCQTYYEGADGTLYWVFAAFSPAGSDGENCPNGYRSQLIAAGEESWGPLTLYAYDAVTGKNAREAFAPLVEDWQVTASAQEGDACRIVMEDADYSSGGACTPGSISPPACAGAMRSPGRCTCAMATPSR